MFGSTRCLRQFAIVFCCFSLIYSFSAQAQDLKPVKDKATKKYGYQAKKKAWVIAPAFDDAKKFRDGFAEVEMNGRIGLINVDGAFVIPPEYDNIGKFDKNGYCELTQKRNGVKFRGVADMSGRIIIPVSAISVDVDRSGEFIYAKYNTDVPGFRTEGLWGVYDNQGQQLFSPQFSYSPSFRDGIGIAKSAVTGLYGVIGSNGLVLKPFEYLNISRYSREIRALGTDLVHHIWSLDLRDAQALPQPGAIIPYDPKNDPVRVAAWHKGPVGRRLYSNMVRVVEFHTGFLGSIKGACNMLPINWGFNRFIRLEPCIVPAGTPDAMRFGSGNRYYTLKAILYEADGRFVQEVCSRGWIEANCGEGAIYNADGKQRWMIMANPNALGLPAYTMDVTDYRPLGHSDVFEGLGFSISEMNDLGSLYEFTNRSKVIYETENVGVCSYIPRMPSSVHARAEFIASKAPVFHHFFRMGDVVNCVVRQKDSKPFLELLPDLVCRYRDHLDDPTYTFTEREEVIYWGPNNARTVRLSLEAVSRSDKYTTDDIHGTEYSYMLALNMFEEDGTWLRTLATAPWADAVKDGVIVFEPLGIALITRPLMGPVWLPEAPLPHTLSALEEALRPHKPGHNNLQPGTGNPKPGQNLQPSSGSQKADSGSQKADSGTPQPATVENRNGSEPRPKDPGPARGGVR